MSSQYDDITSFVLAKESVLLCAHGIWGGGGGQELELGQRNAEFPLTLTLLLLLQDILFQVFAPNHTVIKMLL